MLAGLADKFFGFLMTYIEHRPTEATKFIKENGGMLLPDLRAALPQLPNVQLLCKTLSLDDSKENGAVASAAAGQGATGGGAAALSTLANGLLYSQMERQQLHQEAERFLRDSSLSVDKTEEDLTAILTDLKHASNPRPAVVSNHSFSKKESLT